MATEIIVPSALPQEMNFALPASLPSSKNFEIRVQPVNAQSFTSGNVLQFDIPCGRRGQYLDTQTTYVRFKATYTHAGAILTDYSRLIGSAYSYFNKQEIYGNNSVQLESISELGILANLLLNTQLNYADKNGLSSSMGFGYDTTLASNATTGHRIFATTLDNLTFEYSIPLIGILGSGTDKFFPIGAFYGLRFELTMDSYGNFVLDSTANATTGCTITEVEFVANVVELSPEAQSLIEMQNPNKIHIRSQSFRTSTNTLTVSASAGLYDLLIGCRVSSLKSLYVACSPSNAAEKKFASVNPNLDQGTCLIIAGQNYPQRTISPSNHPSDAFTELQKSIGALAMVNYNGAIAKSGYYSASTAYGLMTAYNTAVASVTSSPNQFFLGFDVETIAHRGGLLSGININQAPSFFRAQIGSALSAYTHTLYFFAFHDVILEIDVLAKTIVAKF